MVSDCRAGRGLKVNFRTEMGGNGLLMLTISAQGSLSGHPTARRLLGDVSRCIGDNRFTPQTAMGRRFVRSFLVG